MTGRGQQPRSRSRQTRLFATSVPGLGRILRRQLDAIEGVDVTGTGFDGHSDFVFLEADRAGRAAALRSRLAENVFAEIGRASRGASPGASAASVASAAWQSDGVLRALSVWADEVRPLARSMTFQVVARVLGETKVSRTELRRALAGLVARDKPRWRYADPAQVGIWICEFHDGQYVAGLQLAGQRPRNGPEPARRDIPRQDMPRQDMPRQDTPRQDTPRALAAAMVDLAGSPGPGPLLDPCAGTGQVLAEALAAGWSAEGTDIDGATVEAAARAAPAASVQLGDARELLLPDDYAGACVTSLPAWQEPRRPGEWEDWVAAALAEMSRVTRTGGAVVLLAPELPRAAIPGALRLRRQVPVRPDGHATTIWVFRRA